MGHPSKSLTGAVVAVYIAGEAVGALVQTFIGDRLGRIRFMQLCCVIVTIGTVVQTASVNMGMFLAGRAIAGAAVGGMVSTVPIYLSEISSPQHRGLIGGISGCGISFGTMMSNWVGMACGYAPYGALQWRLPLGIQIPWGIIMFVGLSTFMPNSPRQLIRKGKVEQARTAFTRIRRDLASHESSDRLRDDARDKVRQGDVPALPTQSPCLHRCTDDDKPDGSECHSVLSGQSVLTLRCEKSHYSLLSTPDDSLQIPRD
jgi:MFS family permease